MFMHDNIKFYFPFLFIFLDYFIMMQNQTYKNVYNFLFNQYVLSIMSLLTNSFLKQSNHHQIRNEATI